MENINTLLDKAKEVRSIASDNALAKKIGVSRQAVSSWRHERTMPDTVSTARLADLAEIPLTHAIGVIGEARAISKEEKAVWRRLANLMTAGLVLPFLLPIYGAMYIM